MWSVSRGALAPTRWFSNHPSQKLRKQHEKAYNCAVDNVRRPASAILGP